jgi:hypothetical protein
VPSPFLDPILHFETLVSVVDFSRFLARNARERSRAALETPTGPGERPFMVTPASAPRALSDGSEISSLGARLLKPRSPPGGYARTFQPEHRPTSACVQPGPYHVEIVLGVHSCMVSLQKKNKKRQI